MEFLRYLAGVLVADLAWPAAVAVALWFSTRGMAPAARDVVLLRSLTFALLCTWLDVRSLRRRVDSLGGNDDMTRCVQDRVRRNRERSKEVR
ncbi:MAG: hypothetical protein EPO40_19620 [Myxococcaceae bacterium]|nr:MAG: hypothetical protein EPO40_19620 [Myxococcaceae bacterium]